MFRTKNSEWICTIIGSFNMSGSKSVLLLCHLHQSSHSLALGRVPTHLNFSPSHNFGLFHVSQWFTTIYNVSQWFTMFHSDLQWFTMLTLKCLKIYNFATSCPTAAGGLRAAQCTLALESNTFTIDPPPTIIICGYFFVQNWTDVQASQNTDLLIATCFI